VADPTRVERVTIDHLGARGDGFASTASGPVYVAYALPAEIVEIERRGSRGRLLSIARASTDRVEPFCPYFGACGGCVAQHVGPALYGAWKRDTVANALAKAGIQTELEPLVDAHGEGRRRITLHARFHGAATRVGYMAPRSHDLVEIAVCPIAEPALDGAPRVASALAEALARARKPLDVQVTATQAGLDIEIRGHGPIGERERQTLITVAAQCDLARLSLHGEVLVERRPPLIRMGRAQVAPPPGGFLQATRAGEEALAARVLEALAGARRVADLFAGCGPFALRLAEAAEVHAVDGDRSSLAALDKAARNTERLRRVATETRDLFRRPLLVPELSRFDAVVLDPPRAGAEAQAKQLAQSRVPVVVSVSCEAGTFARDAAILVAGGYRLERVTPIDQFKYSPHVEIVGVFRREKRARR
jgi:23S rRNA (uracil1939-C5)-methyltransferase